MIKELYPAFQHWSATGSVYLTSDSHFDDTTGRKFNQDIHTPVEVMDYIAKQVHKNDTLIHLGDVGNPAYFLMGWKPNKRPHLVLITGNHDTNLTMMRQVFDEVYTGPLFITPQLLISHEPMSAVPMCFYNIHGHQHGAKLHPDRYHMNLAANNANCLYKLDMLIHSGIYSKISSQHRQTIHQATARKQQKQKTPTKKPSNTKQTKK